MYKTTNNNGSGGYPKTNLTIELELLAYQYDENRKEEFKRFYNTQIRGWLAKNRVAYANAWIVGKYLIVATTQNPPWGPTNGKGGIPKLKEFLTSTNPTPVEELDKYTLSLWTNAERKSA